MKCIWFKLKSYSEQAALAEVEFKSAAFFYVGVCFLIVFWLLVEVGGVMGPAIVGQEGSLNLSLFLLISGVNLLGLSGGVALFTPWPTLVLVFSLTFWSFVMFYSISFSLSNLTGHFTPSGLALVGSLPMTFIEILGVLMRPLTLGMRLCANIAGGHLIGELVEEMGGEFLSLGLIHLYETFVCFMQALIFSLLLFNYFKEVYWFSMFVFFIYTKKVYWFCF